MKTKRIAERLKRRFMTNDPFSIAQSLKINVVFEPLGDIRGYYNYCFRSRFIHINSDLDFHERKFVCAHELGHALMHERTNTNFLLVSTNFSIDKLENEANRFAADLLFADEELLEYLHLSADAVASFLGISVDLAAYRLASAAAGRR